MLKVLIGKKGTGKTKELLDNVNKAVSESNGNVIFISNDMSRKYDINTKVRMADTSDFEIKTWGEFLGFISGIISSNFDITNIYVDGTLKIVNDTIDGFDAFLGNVDELAKKFNIDFMFSVSMDADTAPDYVKKYVK